MEVMKELNGYLEYNGLIYVFYFSVLENGKAIDHWGWTTPAEFPNNWRFGGDLLNNTPSYQNAYAHKPFVVKKDNTLYVHGDIRHLEMMGVVIAMAKIVHGDIRHLEKLSFD